MCGLAKNPTLSVDKPKEELAGTQSHTSQLTVDHRLNVLLMIAFVFVCQITSGNFSM